MIWLQKRLRQLAKLSKQINKTIPESTLRENTVLDHCSDHLNSLILSKKMELKLRVIFLRSKCPFIFESKSDFIRKWKILQLLIIAYVGISYPYMIYIDRKISDMNLYITTFFDIAFWADEQSFTAMKVLLL